MKLSLKHLFMPLVVLAYVGVAVTFLGPIFNVNTRWGVTGFLLVYLAFRRQITPVFRTGIALAMLTYCAWAVVTTAWSEQQQLSFLKSGAALFVTIPVLAGGFLWAREHDIENVLNLLLPLTIAALLAGLLGRFSTASIVYSGKAVLYQGLVLGPNMFGSMLAMCSPLLIWKVYHHSNNKKKQAIWAVATAIGAYYLFAASSRGSIMVVLVTLLTFFSGISLQRRIQYMVFGVIGLGIVLMLVPDGLEKFKQKYIYKQGNISQGVLYTRQTVWEESLEKAKEGGFIGGGFGVSIGDHKTFGGGLTAIGYGREKGNTQLAIVEELGLMGFAIYLVLLILLLWRLFITAYSWPSGPHKQVLLLATGAVTGMIVHSVFEAWWVAPGSPEYVYFWTMAGVALGLTTYQFKTGLRPMEARIRQRHRRQLIGASDGAAT